MRQAEVRCRMDTFEEVTGMDREQLDEWVTKQIEK